MSLLRSNFEYFKHIIRMTFCNIPRLLLSISGLIVGLVVLTVGSIMLDTYYNELKTKVDEILDSSIVIKTEGENKILDDLTQNYESDKIWKIKNNSEVETISYETYTNGYCSVLNANIVGVTPNVNNVMVMDYDENRIVPIETRLISGRWIDGQDLSNERKVVLIDEFTANTMFGTIECIGKEIKLGVQGPEFVSVKEGDGDLEENESFEIIGVFANEELTKNNILKQRKFEYMGKNNLILNTRIYVPMTVYDNLYEESQQCEHIILNDVNNVDATIEKLEKYNAIYGDDNSGFDILTKEIIMQELEDDIKPMKIFMVVILLALFVVSGINSMNIMFFSVKERMGEIGIKKALGATGGDIVLQFMLEGLIISYIAGIISFFVSAVMAKLIGNYIENRLFISFSLNIATETIWIIFVVTTLYGLIFSFVPSFIGAKSKVTDSLRFE